MKTIARQRKITASWPAWANDCMELLAAESYHDVLLEMYYKQICKGHQIFQGMQPYGWPQAVRLFAYITQHHTQHKHIQSDVQLPVRNGKQRTHTQRAHPEPKGPSKGVEQKAPEQHFLHKRRQADQRHKDETQHPTVRVGIANVLGLE